MKFFKNKLAVTVIVLSVTFLGIIIFTVKSGSNNNAMSASLEKNSQSGSGNVVTDGVNRVLNPVQKLVYSIADKVNGTLDFFTNFSQVKKENDELKKKNIELENKLIDYDSFKRENEEFRSALDFKSSKENYDLVGVNIIGKSGGSFFDGYVIDKGTNNGVEKDMTVISPAGLVGVVTEANSNSAKVQPIINENIAVSALVQSTRESTGIIRGYRDNNKTPLTKLYYLPIDSEIKEGDVIVTSGLGELYPKNIRIGEVLSVEEDKTKGNKNAIIKPYVDFNKLEELFIVVPKDKSNGIKYSE